MASKFVEDIHVSRLQRLLLESGLECVRSPQLSIESEVEEGVFEEQDPLLEENKAASDEVVKEEEIIEEEIEIKEEEPAIFPSPSLRKLLPDKIRHDEEQNRIPVLPLEFNTDIDPNAIPKIAYTTHQKCIDILGEIVGCKRYKISSAEFWFLDTLANLLRRAQEDELNRPTQVSLILWFCEWMKEIQHFDAADRQRMLRRFQDNMLAAAKFVAEEERLPTPVEAGVHYDALEEPHDSSFNTETMSSMATPSEKKPSLSVAFAKNAFACTLRDLTMIFHYIYDIFSTDFQFDLVRSIFTFTPDFMLIEFPYQLQNPKSLLQPLKVKTKKEKSPKKESKSHLKGKKKESDTLEFLALMKLKAKEEQELEEQEERDRQEYHLRSHILPLNLAATEELFDQYWPPPPPSEPEPEPEPDPKLHKGKGKK